MSALVRPVAAAFSIAGVVASIVILSCSGALAQAKEQTVPTQIAPRFVSTIEQVELTEKQIKGMLAASKDIDAITDNAPEDIDKLKPETIARLDAVARRSGLASYAEYLNVNENVSLVLTGYDPVTKRYVGREALINLRMARIQSDKKMSAAGKKEAITDLNDALQFSMPAVKYKGNIDLAIKYRGQIDATMRKGD